MWTTLYVLIAISGARVWRADDSRERTMALRLWTAQLAFNGGLTAYASSTIGDGAAGLTVSGNSTTTGNAYFAGNVGIGTNSPSAALDVIGSAATVAAYITGTNAGGQAELQDEATDAIQATGAAASRVRCSDSARRTMGSV